MAARYASLQLAPLASGILIRVARAARAHEPRRSIQLCRHTLTHVHCALAIDTAVGPRMVGRVATQKVRAERHEWDCVRLIREQAAVLEHCRLER